MSGEDTRVLGDPLRAALGSVQPHDPVEPGRMFEDLQAEMFGTTPAPIALDRYEVGEQIGHGGLGVVYRGFDPELSRDVAIKLIPAVVSPSQPEEDVRARLLREAQALARVSHPNVVAVYDVGTYGEDRGEPGVFIVMELIDGPTLREWSRARKREVRETVRLFLQAARGLAAAHDAGLVHRDFKPGNAIVGPDGRVRVLDFGLARGQDEEPDTDGDDGGVGASLSTSRRRDLVRSDLTVPGTVMGTPLYMSPEQHRGEPVGPASDQYSFCVALSEALGGKPPFSGETEDALSRAKHAGAPQLPAGPGIPGRVQAVLRRGLSVEAARRFPSMHDLVDALHRHLRRRRLWPVAAAVVVAGAAASAAMVLRDARPPAVYDDASIQLTAAAVPAVACDQPTPLTARIVHDDGVAELGVVRDAASDPEGRMVATLDGAGALRLSRGGGPAELVAQDVVPGLAVCPRGDGVVYVQREKVNRQHPDHRLFVSDGETGRGIPLAPRHLDRLAGVSPDCATAFVVLRHGGWPVLATVDLVRGGGLRALANADLEPGSGPPSGFVAPPAWGIELQWTDGVIRYGGPDGPVELHPGNGVRLDPAEETLPARVEERRQPYRLPLARADGVHVTRHFDLGGSREFSCGDRTFPGHGGTDFAGGGPGLQVLAAADGRVLHAHDGEADGCEDGNCHAGGGFGNHVIIRHPDGKHTVYAHLERFSVAVRRGDRVSCGDVLGRVGSSGPATGPHLHFEVRNAGGHATADDPYTGPCGGPITYWADQGATLPGLSCG